MTKILDIFYYLCSIKFKLNLYPVLLFATVWSYGFMGMLTRMGGLEFAVITLALCSLLIVLYFLNRTCDDAKVDSNCIEFEGRKLIQIGFVFLIFLSLTWLNFNPSLHGDELSHSFYSQYHLIYVITKLSTWFPKFELSKLVWGSGLGLILLLFLYFFIFRCLNKSRHVNNSKLLFLMLAIFFLVTSRIFLYLIGGFDPTHPPFRLFPLWLSSSLFGLSDLSFRLPGLIGLSIIVVVFYNEIRSRGQSVFISLLSVVAVSSIPVLWSSSYIVEPSIWAALFSTLFLFRFLRDSVSFQELKTLVAILSIFILMRQSIIYILPAMFFLFFFKYRKDSEHGIKDYLLVFAPLLITLPMLLRSIVWGTPAQHYSDAEEQLSVIEAIRLAWSSGLLWEISWSNLGWWLIFLIFATLPSRQLGLKSSVSIILMLSSGVLLFYSIRPILWGIPRYQVEFLVPIILFGLFKFLSLNLQASVKSIVLAVFISLNCYQGLVGSQSEHWVNGYKSIETHPRYDFREALTLAKNSGLAGKTVIVNGNYGRMLEIMSGFSVRDIELLSRIDEDLKIGQIYVDAEALAQDERVSLVLVGQDSRALETKSLIKSLEDSGFEVWGEFYGGWRYQTVVGYIRN